MLKRALFAGAIVAAFGCEGRSARDAAMAGAGAGAPPPVAQTVDTSGTTNVNTGTNVPWQARRTPISRRRTAHNTPTSGVKTATDGENAGTSTP